jgi:hypothetical protein
MHVPKTVRSTALTLLISVPLTSGAHHSNAPHYDRDRPLTIEGVVTEFEFVNPHAFLHIAAVDESGQEVVWNCELQTANTLRRQGWTEEQFVPGQEVTVTGIAARRDAHGCSFTGATMADGTTIGRGGEIVVPEVAEEEERVAFLDGGIPNLAGPWMRDRRRQQGGPGPGSALPTEERMTAAGLAANAGYDDRFDDPSFECSASSISRAWGEPGTPTDIEQTADSVIIRHEYMDTVRTIRLAREHEDNLTPRPYGHSIGWYEGSTLVIDTIGFEPGVLTPHPGIMHSDALHMVERVTANPDDPSLDLEWTAEDAKYFKVPFSGSNHYIESLHPVSEYGCTPELSNR